VGRGKVGVGWKGGEAEVKNGRGVVVVRGEGGEEVLGSRASRGRGWRLRGRGSEGEGGGETGNGVRRSWGVSCKEGGGRVRRVVRIRGIEGVGGGGGGRGIRGGGIEKARGM